MSLYLIMMRTEMQHTEQSIFHWDGNFFVNVLCITETKNCINTHNTEKWIRFLDPLFFGEYPLSMKKLVDKRLPEISQEISNFLVGTLDFVGLNHYTTYYARNDRTQIQKFIMQDATSDAAVISTRKMPKHFLPACSVWLLEWSPEWNWMEWTLKELRSK